MPRAAPKPAKLSRPRLYDPVPRERLFAQMDQLCQFPLVWVVGPPGAGKTSLVSSWLDTRGRPFTWYQVDAGDAEPATAFSFLRQLARSHRRSAKTLPYLTPDYASDLPGFARRFFRQLSARLPLGCVLVFDNCHEAAVPAFHALIEQACSQLPEGMSLIAISRMQAPSEFSRLRANRTLGLLGWQDLRLSENEAISILERTEVADCAARESLLRLADGWAAGLILLASNANRTIESSNAPDINTREALFAYFAGQIFEDAAPELRDMLLRTAMLPEVSPASAALLTGHPQAADLLEHLYQRHYFTDRRTEPELCYRYHDLFREFLIARAYQTLSKAQWRDIALSAAHHLSDQRVFEPAVEIYRQVGAWSGIERVILLRAEELMRQGRWQTLLAWLRMLSESQQGVSPWLQYWRGMAEQVTDVQRARTTFERAAQTFAAHKNRDGEALAISAVVDGFFQEWNTVVTLDPWLDALKALLRKFGQELSPRCLSKARTSLLIGLTFRRPGDPALQECVRAIAIDADVESDPAERLRMMVYLVLYYDLMGDFPTVTQWIARIGDATANSDIPPRMRVWAIFRIAHHYMNAGQDDQALAKVQEALRISQKEGVDTLSAFLIISHAMILLNAGKAGSAQPFLQRALPALKATRPMELVFYKWVEFSVAVAVGNKAQASALWDAFAEVPLIGVPHNLPYNHGTIALLIERGEVAEAQACIDRWREALAGMGSTCLSYNLDLMQAYVLMARGDSTVVAVLKTALTSAAAYGFYGNLCWIPQMMRPLCALALREGIEPDFVMELIRRKRLSAPAGALHWAWPVRVYALARFAVFRDREQLRFAHRPQHRPLELLQAIIASGGAGTTSSQLKNWLWPDAEGDAANNALNATLHRLRKLLGESAAVVVDDGRVWLNAEICWVDAFAFDQAASRILSNQASESNGEDVVRLYSGHFLGSEVDTSWAITYRDRLRAKFQRLVTAVAGQLERQHRWHQAADLYRRALEVDNLQEESYRRLMVCLRECSEIAEAKNVYRRCSQMLSIALGVKPSPETTAVFQGLSH
jgi:LuxR family transcriptional regulator, maltose regulon positive regulatory protein